MVTRSAQIIAIPPKLVDCDTNARANSEVRVC